MKRITSTFTTLVVVIAFTLTGVSGSSAGVALGLSNAVVASATGAGMTTFGGEQRTFAFSVRKYADGSVKGEAQLDNRFQERRSHVVIDCLVVNGNRAYVSGIVTRSTVPGDVGLIWDFAVEDNGEGSGDPTDRMTLLYVFFPQIYPCTSAALQAYLDGVFAPIESGNIQVH